MNEDSFQVEIAQFWALPSDAADLTSELEARIAWLLKHDYERLLNAVYLLDLPERAFREAMALASNEATARRLAELILVREREKFESRRRYRRNRSMDVPANEVDEPEK